MALARYFMYKQVYFHHVRRAYDIHLKDYLKEWLPDGAFPVTVAEHLKITDNEVTAGLLASARDRSSKGHIHARRLTSRLHFKRVYERNPGDQKVALDAVDKVYNALKDKFGEDNIRRDSYPPKMGALEFPVLHDNGSISSSTALSDTLNRIPSATFDLIFCDRDVWSAASGFLETEREKIIQSSLEQVS